MKKFSWKNPSKTILIGVGILLGAFFLSIGLRLGDLNDNIGAQNLEAPYHVLLTVKALKESPISNHWLLPTVSLGRHLDKFITWGSTLPTATGDYIYTSFTPIGFLAPYLWFALLGQSPTIENLAWFNIFLSAISIFSLFFFLLDVLRFRKVRTGPQILAVLGGLSVSIFSREALLSHGIVYWHQCLYQIFLIWMIFGIWKFLSNETFRQSSLSIPSISLLALIGPMTEWTGYVFNLGVTLTFWVLYRNEQRFRKLIVSILGVTLLAGLLTLLHYGAAIGFQSLIKVAFGQFWNRSIITGPFTELLKYLLKGYTLSFGLFLLVGALSLIQISKFSIQEQKNEVSSLTLLLIFLTFIPMIENAIMLQHAMQFSYDRLKLILPLSILTAIALGNIGKTTKLSLLSGFIAILVVASSFQGYQSYKADLQTYASWATIHHRNQALRDVILHDQDADCAVYLSSWKVRGYANFIFHKGIYERRQPLHMGELMIQRNACASIYIHGKRAFPDLPRYTKVEILRKDGSIKSIALKSDGTISISSH